MARQVARARLGITPILLAAFILSGSGGAAAEPAVEGPVPRLVGTWQSQTPNNDYVIHVAWNAATGRYEGTLIRQGLLSTRSGLVLGEVCWIASPVSNQPYLRGAQEVRASSPRVPRPQWRPGPVRLDPGNPNLLFTGATRFVRVVAAGPATPQDATPATSPRTPVPEPGVHFPSVAAVIESSHGANEKDGAARQEASFTLLTDVLEQIYHCPMGTSQGMPPDTAALYGQYKQAAGRAEEVILPGKSATVNMSSPAIHYYFSPDFRRETLSRYVPQPIIDDYEKRHWADQAQAIAEQERAAAANTQRERDALAAQETKRSLEPDLKVARTKHIDLGVFGVQLGEVIHLPSCESNDSDNAMLTETLLGSSAAQTCVADKAGTFSQGLAQFIAASNSVPWVSSGISVKLGMAQCPSWMKQPFGCAIIFNVQNRVALGAMFQTNGVDYEPSIIKALSEKYGGTNRHEGGEVWCRNTLTGIKTERSHEQHWDVGGILHVSYEPIHACSTTETYGRVSVELNRFRQARANAERKVEENQPKM